MLNPSKNRCPSSDTPTTRVPPYAPALAEPTYRGRLPADWSQIPVANTTTDSPYKGRDQSYMT